MRVAELWRYPVKSLQGQRLDEVDVGLQGLVGDRAWALFDPAGGLGLTARRVPELLFASGRLRPGGGAEVVLPDGTATADDAVLSRWLGRPVVLRRADPTAAAPRYESPDDGSPDDGSPDDGSPDDGSPDDMAVETAARWYAWEGAPGAFHDLPGARVTLVSTGTVGARDRRRFRANVVLDGAGEDELVGRRVRLGGAVLDVGLHVPRCVMVTRPQPGGLARDTDVLRRIHRERGGVLAVGATVARPGTAAVGDELVAA